ncbi:Gfo/Idh/MocA family oxidoreductase, partial [Candidatus Micrarchaeota archaeon]|nr:Gfo/Idh/MocA family oxidoreductase [Candidatus Micrarchaeota archaeon]
MKILVVGTGVMGFNHVRVLNDLKQVSKVVVVDESEQALARVREKNFEKTELFSSLKQALAENAGFDAAVVAVPTRLHYEVASELLEKEIPLLVEKPITDSVADGKKLLAKAEKKNVVLAVGH